MSIAPSLKSRVLRLEAANTNAQVSLSGLLRRAREARLARTPLEQAVHDLQQLDRCLDVAAEPDVGDLSFRLARARGRRHLQAMAALAAPDVSEPIDVPLAQATVAQLDAMCNGRAAKMHQDYLRQEARKYLAAVELAKGHYTPKARPAA